MSNAQMQAMSIDLTECIARSFYALHDYIRRQRYTNYWLKGGRGSTKSTFPSIEIVLGIQKDELANAMCCMKVGTTIETGVFYQIGWAIDKLNLNDYWKPNKQKYYYTHKLTGQKIYCKGCDEAYKFKSIKLLKGYFKYQWFEETDAFDGFDEIRNIQQSLTRAGLKHAIRFYTYNPPKTMDHWLNRHIIELQADITKGLAESTIIHHSTYLDVLPDWLGEQFLADAAELKVRKPKAYEHEYLGEVTGTGGAIFVNVKSLKMTQEIMNKFGYTYIGLDWGAKIDPMAYTHCYLDKTNNDLYIFDELYEVGIPLDSLNERIREKNPQNKYIQSDTNEQNAMNWLSARGHNIGAVIKGAGSPDFGIKWLQNLNNIYIDPIKCPHTYREFVGYEYAQNKDGTYRSSYPDKDNHSIDSIRYALADVIRSSGVGKIMIKR